MSRRRAILAAAAGPLLIVAATLVVLRETAFGGQVTAEHYDPLAFWLPTHCFLGTTLAAGEIPTWNPFSMGGMPFAANPQSGWLYLPAMALYAALPCGAALSSFIVLQPILAGLGTYAFLRSEQLSRPAATVGGVALALVVSGSMLAASLPFSGSLAWIAILLACASRWLRVRRSSGRLAWLLLTALAWGQLAAAHPTDGLAIGTGLLAAFTIGKLISAVRGGQIDRRGALLTAAFLAVALPLVNLALLLPRLTYVPRTTLGLGFRGIEDLSARIAGGAVPGFRLGRVAEPAWPLKLAAIPGAYLGGIGLVLATVAAASRRHRALVLSLGSFAAACYVLSLRPVAEGLTPLLRPLPLSDFYLHSPWRLRFGVLAVLPVLAAVGFDLYARSPAARSPRILLPGIALWGALPLALGVSPARFVLFAAGLAGGLGLFELARRRPGLVALVPVFVAVELSVAGLIGQARPEEGADPVLGGGDRLRPLTNLPAPEVDLAAYLRPDAVTRALPRPGAGRYLTFAPEEWIPDRGFRVDADPATWPLMANNRAVLFGAEQALGYDPVQLLSYWIFVRVVEGSPVNANYRQATFTSVHPVAADLLQVTHVVAGPGVPPEPDAVQVARAGNWAVWRRDEPAARASFVPAWTVASSLEAARAEVTRPGFDPSEHVVLEAEPGIPAGASGVGASVRARPMGTKTVVVEVKAQGPGIVLIRNVWDRGWRATMDGHPTPVLRADALVQAVAVDRGSHEIVLRHHDPWISVGLLGSALSVVGLLCLAAVARRQEVRAAEGQSRADGARDTDHEPTDAR